jgi:hypothetical protein
MAVLGVSPAVDSEQGATQFKQDEQWALGTDSSGCAP